MPTPVGSRFFEFWLHPSLRGDPDVRWRVQFLVRALVMGAVISAVMVGVYAQLHLERLLLQTSGIGVGLLACLLILRWTGAWGVISHLGLAIVALAFTATPLAEQHFDAASAAWFCIVPFIAVLLRGRKAALVWVPVVLGLLTLLYLQPEAPEVWSAAARVVTFARLCGLIVTVLAFAWAFEDAQHHARRRLEAANLAKSRFLANMSHEIRTPMNGVLGLVEVMLQTPRDAELTEQLGLLRQSGQAMVSLVNGILDLSKIEAGKLTLELRAFSLAGLLDELRGLYAPVAHQRSLELLVERGADVSPDVMGDALRLRQVLCNLLDNALKFTPRGQVCLSATRQGTATTFCVQDSGPGITPEVAARLFTPFEQADATTTRRFGGTGLGLALARQLVELMGGQLQLAGGPGHGARFCFSLELAPAAASQVPLPDAKPRPPTAHGRVLVVDDNAINLKVACALVRALGYEVEGATDGVGALAALERGPWSAVLMDCHMPEMDGYEATRRLRAREGAGRHLPVIALTAAAMQDELQACLAAGMDECLTKPVSLDALRQALARRVR